VISAIPAKYVQQWFMPQVIGNERIIKIRHGKMVDAGCKVNGNHHPKAYLTFGTENGGSDQWKYLKEYT
jgi:hypothetical protein